MAENSPVSESVRMKIFLDRYRLNVVKKGNGTSYSYETNTAKATVQSATSVIASHS